MRSRSFLILVFLLAITPYAFSDPPDAGDETTLPPVLKPGERVPGRYIVVLRDNAVADGLPEFAYGRIAQELAHQVGGQVGHLYTSALKGFSVQLPPGVAADLLARNPLVQFVEQDAVVQAFDHVASEIPTGINRINAERNSTTSAGTGLGVAVIDTGIQLTHPELRVAGGVTFLLFGGNKKNRNGNDDNGHGTHVAGTIGAKDNGTGVVGVSPNVDLYAVKVLDRFGSGYWSDVVRGIDWVAQNSSKIAAANMSLGGPGSDDNNCGNSNNDSVHKAICGAVAKGVLFAVAAGNEAADAGNSRPACYDEVITISALADSDGNPNGTGPATSYGADDTFASFSNFGSDVDAIAPGVSIRSTYLNSGYATGSGTSFSAPHAAGTVALWISRNGRPRNAAGQLTGDAQDPSVKQVLAEISESVGLFKGDPDGIAEPMVNADTAATGGTGSTVCCPSP